MNDVVVTAIRKGTLSAGSISFQNLRRLAGRDVHLWSELERGRAILSTTDQLDQYLYSYGPMIRSQWEYLLNKVRMPSGDVTLVDYGCGQGLGSMLFLEQLHQVVSRSVTDVVLIEPSQVALNRAQHILECYLPSARISVVNKSLDDFCHDDLVSPLDNTMVHLFSNILDVEGFDQYTLFSKIFQQRGRHLIYAVGNERTQYGGRERLETLFELIHDTAHADWLRIDCSKIKSFKTDGGKAAMCFYVELDVDGPI